VLAISINVCGIIGFVSTKEKENPAQFLVEGLKRLEYRGYDSWGIAFGEGPTLFKKVGKISGVSNQQILNLGGLREGLGNRPAVAGLGHTRWATHGGVTDENAHPHLDCLGEVVVAHNGIIENWEELRSELEGAGHRFRSETDTEVVAHLIEDQKVDPAEAGRNAFNRLEGLNAIAAFFPKENIIVAFRNGSPLVVGVGDGEYFLASDAPAFLPYTKRVIFLNDGEGVILSNSKNQKSNIKIINAETGEERPVKVEKITWSSEESEKGEYPHYLIKEIKEQPQVLSRLAEYPEKELKEVDGLIKKSFGTYFTACGTAAYASLAATYLFADLAKRHVNFSV